MTDGILASEELHWAGGVTNAYGKGTLLLIEQFGLSSFLLVSTNPPLISFSKCYLAQVCK